jgi:hypothetical protein
MLIEDYRDLLVSVLYVNPEIDIVISGVLPRYQDNWKLMKQDEELKCINAKAKQFNGNITIKLICYIYAALLNVFVSLHCV